MYTDVCELRIVTQPVVFNTTCWNEIRNNSVAMNPCSTSCLDGILHSQWIFNLHTSETGWWASHSSQKPSMYLRCATYLTRNVWTMMITLSQLPFLYPEWMIVSQVYQCVWKYQTGLLHYSLIMFGRLVMSYVPLWLLDMAASSY